ncbi:MAG: DUF2804 family protein [Ruminococcaceae bacterium]|nr:DUF2804 family protein [Oscillospiraceae bacterium]MBR3595817.1 DUF2804 domain-containing protein [Clostridia bacterium]
MDFRSFLSAKREAVATPDNVIDEFGNCHFGTFDKEFPKMDFLNVNKPSSLPNRFNKYKLTLWEATEINFDKVILLTAVCNMGLFGTALTVLYDKRTKKCSYWQEMLPASKACISDTLLNSAETFSKGERVKIRYVNNFQDGEAIVSGYSSNKDAGTIDYRVKLKRVSKPSIVSIPFDSNRPLYSQKDLFKVEGYLEINGERFVADESTAAIIDDHRGYYPRKSHYDWVTTMGRKEIDGKEQYFGFNLTRNQSINQDDYNENLIWFEGRSTLLTPVIFKHETPFLWHIQDTKGMVDVTFDIGDEFLMKVTTGIINIDYHITFGELRGFVCDPDGNKYILDGMAGIGEDKSLLF